jgi:hypothetical protein
VRGPDDSNTAHLHPGPCRKDRPSARALGTGTVAKIAVFLMRSGRMRQKWQSDIDKRPHYRQTVEQTIALRLSFKTKYLYQCALALGGVSEGAHRSGVQEIWVQESGGVKNAIIVVKAGSLPVVIRSRYGQQTKPG